MATRIGKDLPVEFPRSFIAADADLGDPRQVERLFESLGAGAPADRAGLEAWLAKWSELHAGLQEEEAVRYIFSSRQTDDPKREADYLHYLEKIEPLAKTWRDRLARLFLASPAVADLDRERYFVLVREFKNQVDLYRDENVPLFTEEEKLSQGYQKICGAMTVEHDGRERALQQMSPYLERPDRAVREDAWRKVSVRRLVDRDPLDRLFDEMLDLRGRIAKNADFENYRDFAFRLRGRFDYGVRECEEFHAAVEKLAVPLYRELHERRRRRMGLEVLRPWDLAADPLGRPPLKPFTTVAELIAGCQQIYDRLDPALGAQFRFMADHDLLELESRKGKAPGAYSHYLNLLRYPFIFTSAVGVDYDVVTLLHECGHSFHSLAARAEPLSFYHHAPIEFAEVASMAMEFLGGDRLEAFYSADDKTRSRERHLEQVVWLLAWVATIDAFQHWIYTHPGHDPAARADAWLKIRRRFGGLEDYSGLEEFERFAWHRQLHVFQYPFYYIEYGIAQLGALQVWTRAKTDPAGALAAYRRGLALGGSRPLPELFAAAGLEFDMTERALRPLLERVRKELGV